MKLRSFAPLALLCLASSSQAVVYVLNDVRARFTLFVPQPVTSFKAFAGVGYPFGPVDPGFKDLHGNGFSGNVTSVYFAPDDYTFHTPAITTNFADGSFFTYYFTAGAFTTVGPAGTYPGYGTGSLRVVATPGPLAALPFALGFVRRRVRTSGRRSPERSL